MLLHVLCGCEQPARGISLCPCKITQVLCKGALSVCMWVILEFISGILCSICASDNRSVITEHVSGPLNKFLDKLCKTSDFCVAQKRSKKNPGYKLLNKWTYLLLLLLRFPFLQLRQLRDCPQCGTLKPDLFFGCFAFIS